MHEIDELINLVESRTEKVIFTFLALFIIIIIIVIIISSSIFSIGYSIGNSNVNHDYTNQIKYKNRLISQMAERIITLEAEK